MIKGKQILITGGGGFIGGALSKRLANYNEVTVLDTKFRSQDDPRLNYVTMDVTDSDIDLQLRGQQIIIHAAANLGVRTVSNSPIETLGTNYEGVSNILSSLATAPVWCERFILLSSSEVYGTSAFNVKEHECATFPNLLDTRWCYGIGKLAAEHLALAYHRRHGLPVTIIRPFNIFGPGRTGEHAVLNFIQAALKGERLLVYGNGSQVRAWCYIDDFCDGLLACLENKHAVGEVFNIGNPLNATTVLRLAEDIVEVCESVSKIGLKYTDQTDIGVRVPDIYRAQSMLKFEPKVSLWEGLERTVEWVKGQG